MMPLHTVHPLFSDSRFSLLSSRGEIVFLARRSPLFLRIVSFFSNLRRLWALFMASGREFFPSGGGGRCAGAASCYVLILIYMCTG